MADTSDLKSDARMGVRVRVPSPAPNIDIPYLGLEVVVLDDELDGYQQWLYQFIKLEHNVEDYWQLLLYLSGKDFEWSVKRDVDRERDGFNLRSTYAESHGARADFWAGKMSNRASVLEVMIALAIRCDDITYTPEAGSLTAFIFWKMVQSLGLSDQNNLDFNKYDCDFIINRFLKRRYFKNGTGGLFTIYNNTIDMRKAEIWYQMGAWIMENFT